MAASVADRPMAKMLHNGKGYKISLFLNKNKALQYQCSFCNQICCDAVELFCSKCNETEYKNDNVQEDEKFYCEICLTEWLSSNNTKCPINQNHFGAVYNASHYIRKRINQLITLCPKSDFAQNDVEEGAHVMMTRNINTGCNWKGKLFQLLPHVENACEFAKQEHCKYHQFGCEYVGNNTALKDHDEKCVVHHIDLMQRKFAQLNQEKDTLQKHVSKQNIKIQNIEQQNMERVNVLEQNNIKLNNITIAERKKLSNQMDAIHDGYYPCCSSRKRDSESCLMKCCMQTYYDGCLNQGHKSNQIQKYHPGKWTDKHFPKKWSCCGSSNREYKGCKTRYKCCYKPEKNGCIKLGYYECCNALDSFVEQKRLKFKFYQETEQKNEENDSYSGYRTRHVHHMKAKAKVDAHGNTDVWLLSSGCNKKYPCCGKEYPSQGCQKIIIT